MASTRKLEESKKDMNFFSEFGGSGGQVGSYMSMILIIFLGFIIIGAMVYGIFFIQAVGVTNQIADLKNKMAAPEYQQKLNNYSTINNQIDYLNQEYYDITYLYTNVTSRNTVDTAYMDVIVKNLPSGTILTDFTYDEGNIVLSGNALSYYDPLDLLAALSKENLFSRVQIQSLNQITSDSDVDDQHYLYMEKYNFSIVCSVKENYSVHVTKLVDDATSKPLSALESTSYAIGDTYNISAISALSTLSGENYALSRVVINDVAVTPETLNLILSNDGMSGVVTSDLNIKLYYKPQILQTGVTN